MKQKSRIVTNNCRKLAISEVIHYFNSALHLNLNIFTNLQIINYMAVRQNRWKKEPLEL